MARKKQLLTLEKLIEESSGALIPENETEGSVEQESSLTETADRKRPKKRGRVHRKKSESFKSSLANILSMVISPETVAEAVKSTPLGENITYQEAILIAQVLKASNGDTQAATYLRDTSGNKLKEMADKAESVKTFEEF